MTNGVSITDTSEFFSVFDSYQVFLIEGQKSVLHLEIGNILYI